MSFKGNFIDGACRIKRKAQRTGLCVKTSFLPLKMTRGMCLTLQNLS